MQKRSLLLLVGAITLAAASALVARALMRPPPPVTIVKEVPVAETQSSEWVLVAAHALAPGQFMDGPALQWQEVPEQSVRADQLQAASHEERLAVERQVYGSTVRQPLAQGDVIATNNLLYSGQPGFLAAVLRPGMRAISIPTNAVASSSGLVNAGDRVDVILSLNRNDLQPNEKNTNTVFLDLASETIVRNARVLALNNNTQGIAPRADAHQAPRQEAQETGYPSQYYDSLTLEVSPNDAQRLTLAKEVGTLQVALRSAHPDSASEAQAIAQGVTQTHAVTDIFRHVPRESVVTVYRGDTQEAQSMSQRQP